MSLLRVWFNQLVEQGEPDYRGYRDSVMKKFTGIVLGTTNDGMWIREDNGRIVEIGTRHITKSEWVSSPKKGKRS